MSVVIIGGNERMERQYKQICADCGHRVKIYMKPTAALRGGFGRADLMILFTSTVSHTMVHIAIQAMKNGRRIERSHFSSAAALKHILSRYAE